MKKISLYVSIVCATLLVGCTDEWEKHYDGTGRESAANAPSLWERIQSDSTLAQFCRVLTYVGYDKVLQSPQSLTLFAPVITQQQADSIIRLYDEQKKSYVVMPDGTLRSVQDKDNKAITQFVQNHICLYSYSTPKGAAYKETIMMMNGKKMVLTRDSINGMPHNTSVVSNNGMLYKLNSKMDFQPNVREYMELAGNFDSLAAFYKLFDKYELDENSSVQRGVEDGKIVYADSVLNLSNILYNTLGWIGREDSAYIFLAPTDEVWKSEYEQFLPYFNYVDAMENRDSVQRLNAKMAIIRGRVFNIRSQKNNYNDSIINTKYISMNGYYGLNVFQEPKTTGIFSGLTPWTCSNGQVYTDNTHRIDPKLTFMEDRYLLASGMGVRKSPLLKVNNENLEAVSVETKAVVDSITYKDSLWTFSELKDKNYIQVTPQTYSGVTNRNSSIYFYLQHTLSGLYYNVYLVTVPAFACEDGYKESEVLPYRFQVYYNERLKTPRESLTSDPNDDVDYAAPNQDRALDVPEGETHKSGKNYFLADGDQVDFICIDKARQPQFSAYNAFGSAASVMRYRVTTNVRQTDISKGVQTNVMRINRLIYIGFKTEEEAKAYELDLSKLKEYNVAL